MHSLVKLTSDHANSRTAFTAVNPAVKLYFSLAEEIDAVYEHMDTKIQSCTRDKFNRQKKKHVKMIVNKTAEFLKPDDLINANTDSQCTAK